ncbi:hypothetical protein [Pontibacter kalidii]|uniref:hypothetical protein n=1 Tax=Pontibacter kalidii TaxID=2592049 RepID=UPI00225B5A81|nr:hypothetical protein [Pontibacter kalidii]
MEANKKDRGKKARDQQEAPEDKPQAKHTSQGHGTDAKGTVTNTNEETLRSATTDSSRAPKSSNDEAPTGGNVR